MKLEIPDGWSLYPSAPFLRPTKPLGVQGELTGTPNKVLGVRSAVYGWSTTSIEGRCSNPNCNEWIRFFNTRPQGHVFFMDIDETPRDDRFHKAVGQAINKFGLSHLCVFQTKAGAHLVNFEISKTKAALYELFQHFKGSLKSDYEFLSDWILRLGHRGHTEPPQFLYRIVNRDIKNAVLSNGHIEVYSRYTNFDRLKFGIFEDFEFKETYADMVYYNSWKD